MPASPGQLSRPEAEYKLLHLAGGDAVGMKYGAGSHRCAAMRVCPYSPLSVITDLGIREEGEVIITHAEVLHAAREAGPKLTALFMGLIAGLE